VSANTPAKTGAQPVAGRTFWVAVGLAWALSAAAVLLRVRTNLDITHFLLSYDDLTRLSQVRDFLNGQNWFDTVQQRYNAPFGQSIHWSRLIDVPIAALILVLRPFFGAGADIIATYVWPLMLLAVLLVLSAKLCIRLVGQEGLLPGVVLPLLSLSLVGEFAPGRIDHHNVQILISLGLAMATLAATTDARHGWTAGLLAALSMVIGIEGLLFVVATIAAFGLLFVVDPANRTATRNFGFGIAGATLVGLVITLPPEHWFTPYCDAMSITFTVGGVGAGLALAGLTYLPLADKSRAVRLGIAALFGSVASGLTVGLFPHCLAGPYADLDPWLMEVWLAESSEVLSFWASLMHSPSLTVGMTLPIAVGLGALIARLVTDRRDRTAWLIIGGFFVLSAAVLLFQIRGARLAAAFAVPPGAWLIVTARHRYLAGKKVTDMLLLFGAWLAYAGTVAMLGMSYLTPKGELVRGEFEDRPNMVRARDCLQPASYAYLQDLPPTTLMVHANLGPQFVGFTHHAVVVSAHHRDAEGMRDTLVFMDADEETAREILDRRGVTYLALCLKKPNPDFVPGPEQPLFERIVNGDLPVWLTDVTPPGEVIHLYAYESDQ